MTSSTPAAPLPLSLIVDDPAPCINPLYYFAIQVKRQTAPVYGDGTPMRREIPVEFLEQFAGLAQEFGIRGKFSVLPYPAGLGPVSEGLEGCAAAQVAQWLDIVRRDIVPLFDITPEILTHTMALDLSTMRLLDVPEHEWSQDKDCDTLTGYIARALEILKEAGLDANGVTSPCDFGTRSEPAYARAVLEAQKRVSGRDRTWYFLHFDKRPVIEHRVMLDSPAGRCVSVVAGTSDPFWRSQDTGRTGGGLAGEMADELLSADGMSGRLAELHRHGSAMTICTHWQSLFSNGRRTGLAGLRVVAERVRSVFGASVQWVPCSEQAARAGAVGV